MSSSCCVIADSTQPFAKLHALFQLFSDSALAWLLISLNSLTMMTQAIIYSVALNIGRNELVALMIATSFMEVKVLTPPCPICLHMPPTSTPHRISLLQRA
jgi:hypothetical protein